MRADQLQKWALGAEIAGAVAVVVTLGFLALQMRENTNAVQAQTYQALMQELNDFRKLNLHPELMRITEKFNEEGWQGLTSDEQRRVRTPAMVNWGIYESAYYANERGVLGEREWIRFAVGICRRRMVLADFWDPGGGITPMSELLTPDFVDYIESSCE